MDVEIRSNTTTGTVLKKTGALLWTALLVVSVVSRVPSVQAEIFYNQDGIQLQGSIRTLAYNAYSCNVIEEKHSAEKYEKIKAHQGQPLHLWQVDYSVYNGSGKTLSYLRAQLDLESSWPPCDNWDPSPDLDFDEFAEWTGGWHILQMPYGMRLNQAKQETKYLLVFHTEQPRFTAWDIQYTFDDGTPRGSRSRRKSPPPTDPRRDPVPIVPEQDRCDGKPKGSECWMELANQPGCYIWNPNLQPDESVVWTGECSEGLAQGTGTFKWVWDGGKESHESTGPLAAGKPHGRWVVRFSDGTVSEGPFVEGKLHGRWVVRSADETVEEGPYVEGKRHGHWVFRFSDGTVEEGPYVEDKRHGRWVSRFADGTVYEEGPYVEGKRHGRWVVHIAEGFVYEGPYVEGKRHGRWVRDRADGTVEEIPFVEGKEVDH